MSISSLPSAAQVLRIKNSRPTDQSLWIEPLGDEVVLNSSVLYELQGSNEFGKMEIDLTDDGFVVYGWVRKILAISDKGKETIVWQLADSNGS